MTNPATDRGLDALRPVIITRDYLPHAEGSCLIEVGRTRVLCTASVEERTPGWRRGSGQGWVTAEYGMLPRASHERTPREATRGKQGGRTLEIQRLIGRSLRAVVDMKRLGERTIWIDCDVLQADGGTRTASVTGACVALWDACSWLVREGLVGSHPVRELVAAVSCGVVRGQAHLDLDYALDSACETDMNFVMTEGGRFVEIQGTAEGTPFSREEFDTLAALAQKGIGELVTQQRSALGL